MSNLFSIITSSLTTYIITKQLLEERPGLGAVALDDHGERSGLGPVNDHGQDIGPVLDDHGHDIVLDEHGRALGHHHHHVRMEKSAVEKDIEKVGPHLQQGLGETQSALLHIEVEGTTKKNKTSKYEMSEMWRNSFICCKI